MKVCVSSSGNSIESILDPRFGRATFFIFADTDTMEIESIENPAASVGGGAGITSAQLMVDRGIEAVITGNVGPNAMNVLRTANIQLYKGSPVTVKENIDKFKKGLLDKISNAGPSHFGMGFQRGQRGQK